MSTLSSIEAYNYELKEKLNSNKLLLQKSIKDTSTHVKWLNRLAKHVPQVFIHPFIDDNCSSQKYTTRLLQTLERIKIMLNFLMKEHQKLASGDGTVDCLILFSKTENWLRTSQALHERAIELENAIEQEQ